MGYSPWGRKESDTAKRLILYYTKLLFINIIYLLFTTCLRLPVYVSLNYYNNPVSSELKIKLRSPVSQIQAFPLCSTAQHILNESTF